MSEHTPENLSSDRHLSVLYSFPHPFGAPGIGTTAWNQVRALANAGHHVTVVATSLVRPNSGAAREVSTLAVGGRRIPHRLIGRDRAFDLHDTVAARMVRRGSFDVVHTWPLASERTLAAAAARGTAAVREAPNTHTANAYDVVEREYRKLGLEVPENSHRFNAAHLAREEREWAAATGVLVPSEHVAETFVERGVHPDKLLRHRYGYNPDDIPGPADAAGSSDGTVTPTSTRAPADRPFTAIFVGSGTPRKGLHYALEAWHGMGPERGDGIFRIHGSIESGYADFLAPLLDHPSVHHHGFTSPTRAIYTDADVLLLPSIEEGSALVTYEAQAAGCVPLVSSAAGARIDHNVHGYIHRPRDVTTLTEQLSNLAARPEVLARMRGRALAHASDLTWDAANTALENCYRHAMAATAALQR